MPKPDYYDVLDVPRDIGEADLKRAYRQMALKFHPDRNPGDAEAEEKFKQASEAYEVLRDPERRRVYDTYGHEGLSGQGFHEFTSFDDIFSHFGDIFGDIFGGGRGSRRARRGGDLRYDLELSFEEAAFGTAKDIVFKRREVCDRCQGDGAEPGTSPVACGSCGGAGRITRQQGFFMVQTPCPVCQGAGRVVTLRCSECGGDGSHVVERTVTTKVPAGVDSGVRLRVSGEGEGGGPGAARGDLYVFISVREHPTFQRDGADVHTTREITFSQAALGDEVEVETIHGAERVKIPSGTQPGTVVRLRGKGIQRLGRGGRGDHFVELLLMVPARLDRAQKKLVKELAGAGL